MAEGKKANALDFQINPRFSRIVLIISDQRGEDFEKTLINENDILVLVKEQKGIKDMIEDSKSFIMDIDPNYVIIHASLHEFFNIDENKNIVSLNFDTEREIVINYTDTVRFCLDDLRSTLLSKV